MLLKDFFKTEFLARTGIIASGYSVFTNSYFSERLGFKSFALFTYTLENLNHSQKVKFNYILSGRNTKGVLELVNGERVSSGVIKVPITNSYDFEEMLKNNNIEYEFKFILAEK